MRKSNLLLTFMAALLVLFSLTLVDSVLRSRDAKDDMARLTALVGELGLTDVSLFTEARYMRHLTQADRHTPFQDHPLSLEHFPTGSLFPPPPVSPPRNGDVHP